MAGVVTTGGGSVGGTVLIGGGGGGAVGGAIVFVGGTGCGGGDVGCGLSVPILMLHAIMASINTTRARPILRTGEVYIIHLLWLI